MKGLALHAAVTTWITVSLSFEALEKYEPIVAV